MKEKNNLAHITPKQLVHALYLSQGLFLLITVFLTMILYKDIRFLFSTFSFDIKQILLYGILTGTILAIFEIILYRFIPKKHFDDGGINEKLFQHQSIFSIFFIALIVAISEELLFRGVIQSYFGYIFASSLFVIVHVRYLKKPVLLIMLIFTSFLIGYLYELTNNLLVTISFHFIVDFILGLYIKWIKRGG